VYSQSQSWSRSMPALQNRMRPRAARGRTLSSLLLVLGDLYLTIGSTQSILDQPVALYNSPVPDSAAFDSHL
jgi:hypothetical protein